jgi:SAM-dependent methyltransferase
VEQGTVKSYALMRCPVCGFQSVPGVTPEQLADFYERDYFEGKSAYGYGRADAVEADMIAEALPAPHEWVISHYLDPLEPRSVLEIGPGMGGGWIKRFAADPSCRVQAVEISALASERMNAARIPTFNGRIEDFRPDSRFGLAIGIEVIEHVSDPVSFARSVADALEPGGHVLLSTGNTRSLTAWGAGLDWYYIDPPAHLSYFDDRNIVRLLETAGFDQVRVRRFGFKWVELAMRYRLTAALPLVHAANYASGMIVIARKAS